MRHDQIALQLYTLRLLAADDLRGDLAFRGGGRLSAVELAGLPATAPAELARLLDDSDFARRIPRGHRAPRAGAGAVAARLAEVGCPRVIVPWMPEDDRRTAADVRGLRRSSAGSPARWPTTGSASATTTTPSSSSRSRERRLGHPPGELPPEVELELDVYWAASAAGSDRRDPGSSQPRAPAPYEGPRCRARIARRASG